nr:hypothetical protein [Tanacetum cinerariifolium]
MKHKVVPNNSQVKLKKTQVEDHPRIPSISNKIKSVTACNDRLNSRTLNANAVCATCGKCLVDYDHFDCVTKMLNDVNVASINGKKYILVIIDDYSRYTWTLFLSSKDETPENGVVERRNRTLVEAAGTMLSASKLPIFFCAEAIATACYTQNRSIIIPTHEKMAYHLINDRKPSIEHLYIFGCIRYLTRDGENLDKMKEKEDPCILVGYSTQSKGYRVYNKRTRLIVESIHIRFDEIKEMSETFITNDTYVGPLTLANL